MDYMLELLPVPLELHFVTLRFLLQIQVLLQELIPFSLTLALSFRHFFNNSSILNILRGQILQKLRKNCLLLGRIASARNLLQGDLDILFQVLYVPLFQIQVRHKLHILSFEKQILLGEVGAVHLLQQSSRIHLLHRELINFSLHFVHFGDQSFDLMILFFDKSAEQIVLAVLRLDAIEDLGYGFVFFFYYLFVNLDLLFSVNVFILAIQECTL